MTFYRRVVYNDLRQESSHVEESRSLEESVLMRDLAVHVRPGNRKRAITRTARRRHSQPYALRTEVRLSSEEGAVLSSDRAGLNRTVVVGFHGGRKYEKVKGIV